MRRRSVQIVVVAAVAVVAMAALVASAANGWTVRAQSPTPAIVPPGDTRSEGEGAGIVGSPLGVALVVVALGAGAAGLTTLYLRLTRRD